MGLPTTSVRRGLKYFLAYSNATNTRRESLPHQRFTLPGTESDSCTMSGTAMSFAANAGRKEAYPPLISITSGIKNQTWKQAWATPTGILNKSRKFNKLKYLRHLGAMTCR